MLFVYGTWQAVSLDVCLTNYLILQTTYYSLKLESCNNYSDA